jgi:hypothetical protein
MRWHFTRALKPALFIVLVASGCGSSSSSKNPDANGSADASVDANANACTSYTQTSIASLRQGMPPGCYELDNVIALALTPSTDSPTMYVQDAAGGAYSAVESKCSANSTSHPCSVSAQVAATPLGHSVTLQGTYIRSNATHFEEFYISAITDNGAGTVPAPGVATVADIARGSTNYGLAFQKVSVTLAAADKLLMYDWTPAELSRTATSCPYVFGFGMIPKSVGGITPGAACTNGTSQPPGITTPNAAEVLIDTRFYNGFTVNSDCRCAKMYMNVEPSATSTVSGTIGGILLFDVPYMATTGFMALAPTTGPAAGSEFPITNTVPGM